MVTLIARFVTRRRRDKEINVVRIYGRGSVAVAESLGLSIIENIRQQADNLHQIRYEDALEAVMAESRRLEDEDDAAFLADEVGSLSTEEEQLVAEQTADVINDTLARLFVRLGPPPLSANGDLTPVSSGDGGSAQ
ncbi:hypothetical protein [Streptomyces cyslabdanicus]|uniref:hypothetical protein n=1 Tax=Streptomyces cyslabdanicus TaxID=1470456 RepID=UPI004044D10F